MASLFEPTHRGPGVVYGACGGVWVMILFAPPVVAGMQLARPSLRSMSERFAGGFPTLTWVLPSAGFSMDADSRKTAAAITADYQQAILSQATLIEGSGFQAATVRAIISGIDMMARARAPKKVFAELGPCVDWSLTYRPASRETATGPQIAAALEALRKTLV